MGQPVSTNKSGDLKTLWRIQRFCLFAFVTIMAFLFLSIESLRYLFEDWFTNVIEVHGDLWMDILFILTKYLILSFVSVTILNSCSFLINLKRLLPKVYKELQKDGDSLSIIRMNREKYWRYAYKIIKDEPLVIRIHKIVNLFCLFIIALAGLSFMLMIALMHAMSRV